MGGFMPRISIITVCLNSASTIEATILSVISQNYTDFEYIIVDGGSNDGTIEILGKYKVHISTLISEPDGGISDAFNKGIRLATGELIGIVSSDDYLPENVLNQVAELWNDNPGADVIYGNAIVFEDGNSERFVVKPDLKFNAIWRRTPVKHAATFISRKAYETYGAYSVKYKFAMDYELILRFYIGGAKFIYFDKILGAFKIGGINTRHFVKARKEVREAAIEYGLVCYKANFWFWFSVFELMLKRIIQKGGFYFLVNIYRRVSPRFCKTKV
jgi:glycosyltransferase involved in cell wall biosynthesis